MLQKAASNAYSWWWASHIRTKQSKWLEQNLLDMEEKVHDALKLIEEDGDSFAKRAEMYYKKRPELINFVEESYRAYRALAERYDKISTELQNANNTIASVFPEQIQFAMDEEDEEASFRFSKRQAEAPKSSIPKVPKAPITDLKSVITLATKKLKPKKASSSISVPKSGLSKPEALEKIDCLQKRILTLQTEKEFMRSMYENGVAKYWEIEKQIKETQDGIFCLQDEFGENLAIEDDEARSLMATAALKSCQETLAELQKKQDQSAQQAKLESGKIKDARHKLLSLGNENVKMNYEPPEMDTAIEERQELEFLGEKIKDHSESNKSLSVTEMAEKIDELVLKVIGLGTSVSSQTALVKRLSTETDELQAQIRTLEDDKATLIDGKIYLTNKLKEMEKNNAGEVKELVAAMSEDKLQITDQNEEQGRAQMADTSGPPATQRDSVETQDENIISSGDVLEQKPDEQQREQEEEPDWQQMFINGLEGREKILLQEYTTTLRNFKDVKRKLGDAEQKTHDSLIESSKQMRELKNSNAVKDEEIKSLRQKLVLMQKCFFENKDVKDLQSSAEKEKIDKILITQSEPISEIEEKFRVNIDELLEENLDFWLKFSTSLHEIQKFETGIQDLQSEVTKLEEKKKKADGGSSAKYSLKSDARPIYKYLREIQTELTVWLEKSVTLKDELQSRFSSLCNIQEEITAALKVSAEADDFKFTSYQAAKFQGEVLNMKQENNRVAEELKAGIEFVTTLQLDVETTLSKMNEEFRLAASKRQDNPQLKPSESRNRVPLRSFIFGSRTRRQKPSLFSYVAPAMHRKYHGLKSASPL